MIEKCICLRIEKFYHTIEIIIYYMSLKLRWNFIVLSVLSVLIIYEKNSKNILKIKD